MYLEWRPNHYNWSFFYYNNMNIRNLFNFNYWSFLRWIKYTVVEWSIDLASSGKLLSKHIFKATNKSGLGNYNETWVVNFKHRNPNCSKFCIKSNMIKKLKQIELCKTKKKKAKLSSTIKLSTQKDRYSILLN